MQHLSFKEGPKFSVTKHEINTLHTGTETETKTKEYKEERNTQETKQAMYV
jgi:hypothetical protein